MGSYGDCRLGQFEPDFYYFAMVCSFCRGVIIAYDAGASTGLQLQLVVYMDAALEMEELNHRLDRLEEKYCALQSQQTSETSNQS